MIKQNGEKRKGFYVSVTEESTVLVDLKYPDLKYLQESGAQVTTFWFVDCVPYGQSLNYSFLYNFTKADKPYDVEALLIASFGNSSDLTEFPLNVTVPSNRSTTTQQPPSSSTEETSNDVNAFWTTPQRTNNAFAEFPSPCLNSSVIPADPNKTYGYFYRKFIGKGKFMLL